MIRGILLFGLLALTACEDSVVAPAASYVYRVPIDTGDGWRTGHVADVGLKEAPLVEMVDRIRDGSYTNIHGVLIARGGRLVLEEYFPGTTTAQGIHVSWDRERLHSVHSVTKSVNSALIGIALARGLIPSVDVPVASFFTDYAGVFEGSTKAGLTLRHFLTMSAGLEWDEHSHPYTDARNTHVQLSRSGDPVGFTLRLPQVAAPGERFRYNSGLSIVLGEVVRRASGMSADAFAREYLFGPLGITDSDWYVYPDGTVQTGGGLSLRPRDMAKFGQLYLDGGTWNGGRILEEDWVRESTMRQAPDADYGYQWWGITLTRRDNVFDLSDEAPEIDAAVGRGGQWVMILPELDLVVVFTGGNDDERANQPMDILRRYVYKAVY